MQVNAKIIKKGNATALLEIEVDTESVKTEFKSVTGDYQKVAVISGFRKGKAPIDIVKVKFKSKISEDVLGNLIPKAYTEAIKKTELAPYTSPDIKVEISDEAQLKFTAGVQLRPEINISSYKNLSFHRDEFKISSKDIDKEIARLQDRFADFVQKENGKIEDDDVVQLDIEALDSDNNKIKELSNENHRIEIKKYNLYDEFYDNLIGAKANDVVEFTRDYPKDFNNEKLAGTTVLFKMNIKEVRAKKRPDLSDEFAKDVGDYKTLDELKDAVEKQMEGTANQRLDASLDKAVLDKLISDSKFVIPDKLIQDRANSLLSSFKENLLRQGKNFNTMLQNKMIDQQRIEQEVKEQAEKDLKEYMIVNKISEIEDIKVEGADIDKFIEDEARRCNQKLEDFKKTINDEMRSYVRQTLLVKKIYDFLKKNNRIKKGKTLKIEDILNNTEGKR